MIELKNSKKTYLGKTKDDRNKFALDCHIGAIQYKDNLGIWQGIAPRLVQSGNKYVSEGVPYLMEFDSLGGRREYPDKYDLSKYISLPAMPLFQNLPKTFYQDRIVFTAPKFDLTMGLGKTGTYLEILFREAPAFDKITLAAESVGFDISKLLSSKQDLGIPKPRLIDSSEEPIERMLDWSFKDGQLEVGFDMTGLTFPFLFKNSPLDVQVGASLDDAHEKESDGSMSTTGSSVLNYSHTSAAGRQWGGYRFVSVITRPNQDVVKSLLVYSYDQAGNVSGAILHLEYEEAAVVGPFPTHFRV